MSASDSYLSQILDLLKSEGFPKARKLESSNHRGDYCSIIRDARYQIQDNRKDSIFPAVHIWMKPRVATPEIRLGWYNLERNIPMVLGNNITRIKVNRRLMTGSLRASFKDQLEGLKLDLKTLDEQREALEDLKKNNLLDTLLELSETAARIKQPLKREEHLVDAWHFTHHMRDEQVQRK